MHLLNPIPLSLLALLPLAYSAQVPFETKPSTSSTNLVDALSADPDFTSLLSLLQRARLIPTLNGLNGSTLFAPTNDAIKRHALSNSLWDLDQSPVHDNVQEKLRQQLFYHLLNYSIPALPQGDIHEVRTHKTLHFPRKPLDPPSRDPPPSPPWMPIPGGTLGGDPQRLRVAARDDGVWVGSNAFGDGGVHVVKGRSVASNGVLLGIDGVLEPPSDLATVVSGQSSLTYFHRIMNKDITKFLEDSPQITLFLPVDSAWDALHPIERQYLESEFATDDLTRILQMHAVMQEGVTWSESFTPGVNLTTIDGTELQILGSSEQTTVSGAGLVEPDIYASNGVLHTVSSLLIPEGSLQLTPEKFLLTLNCTKFVSMIHSVNLTSLINDTESKYTVLAPTDDVISLFGGEDLPEQGTEELKKVLQYHFIPGRWSLKKLKNGMLLETALEEQGLDGGRQVLDIEVTHSKDEADKEVRFGGAGTIGEHVEVNNTLIYFVSRPIMPPVDALQASLPSLNLSSFLAAVFSTALADTLKAAPRTTILVPHNSAFERLGMLVSDHLLAASSKSDLSHVILHHTIDGVQYAQSLRNVSDHSFPTLDGSDLRISNGTVNSSGGWPGMDAELELRNLLTETGVVHELSDILIPRSVELTVGKLAKAAKGTIMTTMLSKAGFDWVLNATAPPEGSPWADQGFDGAGWTLLCPPDDALKRLDLTTLYQDVDRLRAIVSQHLIPAVSKSGGASAGIMEVVNNNRPLSLANGASYTTLLSPESLYGDILIRDSEGSLVLGIKGARGTDGRGDWAKVLSWGRATTGNSVGGVIAIDRMLVPYSPPWWVEYGQPIGGGIIGTILIGLFFLGVRAVWNREIDATYEPIDS